MRSFAVLVCLAWLLAGCTSAGGPGTHAGEAYQITSPRALFYTYGPSQASGPDFALSQGDRVTMLSREYGFSHVAVQATGQSGYIATEDLAPAPPAAKPSPSPAPAGSRLHRRHGDANSRPPTPEEQSQIPLPEFPESKPPPGAPPFRY